MAKFKKNINMYSSSQHANLSLQGRIAARSPNLPKSLKQKFKNRKLFCYSKGLTPWWIHYLSNCSHPLVFTEILHTLTHTNGKQQALCMSQAAKMQERCANTHFQYCTIHTDSVKPPTTTRIHSRVPACQTAADPWQLAGSQRTPVFCVHQGDIV